MDSGPAIFTGLVFSLFGGGLLGWTAVRLRQRQPVAEGVSPAASATVATLVAVTALTAGAWCLARV
ncbi:hypothetical protein [Streptomyces sp. NPDC003401]